MVDHFIQIIAEGSTKWQRFIRRWGLSILIGEDVLFDTFGDPKYLMRQIKKKKIDISKIKHIVLSHEHWDHINGLWSILSMNHKVTVYLGTHFSDVFKIKVKAVCQKLVEVHEPIQITPSIFTIQELMGVYDGRPLYETGLVLKKSTGLTLLLGCAHPGLKTMISSVQAQFKEPIEEVIGGFHLQHSSLQEIQSVIGYMKEQAISKVEPLHCTGKLANQLIRNSF